MRTASFHLFGFSHLIVLSLTFGSVLLLILNARRIRKLKANQAFRRMLAAWLAVSALSSWLYNVMRGYFDLPLHLCDLALILIVCALLNPRLRFIGQLGALWALAGSTQAIFTPDLSSGFLSVPFLLFFLTHCSVVVSAVYLMVRGFVSLTLSSVFKAWLITNGYAAAAFTVNVVCGTNFGYLMAKPSQPSLLDYFGPWPYYILTVEFIALGLFWGCYLLNGWVDRLARRH